EIREEFLLVDANGDGRISKEDLKTTIDVSAPGEETEELRAWTETLFTEAWQAPNHIEYTEWLAAILQQRKYHSEEAIAAAFRVFDTNGDGGITPKELGKVLVQSADEVERFFPDFDLNGDGAIDLQEFQEIFRGAGGQAAASGLPPDFDDSLDLGAVTEHTQLPRLISL
ncbi:Calcium-dependent protein kinase 3 (PfCDPK3), partial [Durusdinium trenchii]